MTYNPAYMQQSLVDTQETPGLYNTAMQGLSSYANNIMSALLGLFFGMLLVISGTIRGTEVKLCSAFLE